MKNRIIIIASIALLAFGTISSKAADEMDFGGPDSISYSTELWAALVDANLVGDSATPDKPYKGVHPHGAILETLTSEVTVGNLTGTVVVKRNYGGEGLTMDMVAADRAKHLKAVTVMFKREEGYDSDNQDWFWSKYKPDGSLDTNPKGVQLAGRVAKGKPKGCISCHTGAPGGDYLFTN